MDESGDHNLKRINDDFPIFALSMVLCEERDYREIIVPEVNKLKMDFFGSKDVILRSRKIRKAEEDFGFLTDKTIREKFTERLNQIMAEMPYSLIVTVIRKQQHLSKYGIRARNPYDLALLFSMERLLNFMETHHQEKIHIQAEKRGKKEDEDLERAFLRVTSMGTYYNSATRFRSKQFILSFVAKSENIIGTQIADLVAYPTARTAMTPRKPHPSYGIIESKFYRGTGRVRGLKIFP